MGFRDGRELDIDSLSEESPSPSSNKEQNDLWVTGINCSGKEQRLDACKIKSFTSSQCPLGPSRENNQNSNKQAGIRCL